MLHSSSLGSPVSLLNESDSHWILCYSFSKSTHILYAILFDKLLFKKYNYTDPFTDQVLSPWRTNTNFIFWGKNNNLQDKNWKDDKYY
ncbi:hypothetical protein H8356DRAFT_1330442 [Neocallimastix lanati (nom. inval.)]|nr:hypothetical protein H8356DRAFT_1330442 [Neocallimastix sp. JGI-2020a]